MRKNAREKRKEKRVRLMEGFHVTIPCDHIVFFVRLRADLRAIGSLAQSQACSKSVMRCRTFIGTPFVNGMFPGSLSCIVILGFFIHLNELVGTMRAWIGRRQRVKLNKSPLLIFKLRERGECVIAHVKH
jgi:hypothetical protein